MRKLLIKTVVLAAIILPPVTYLLFKKRIAIFLFSIGIPPIPTVAVIVPIEIAALLLINYHEKETIANFLLKAVVLLFFFAGFLLFGGFVWDGFEMTGSIIFLIAYFGLLILILIPLTMIVFSGILQLPLSEINNVVFCIAAVICMATLPFVSDHFEYIDENQHKDIRYGTIDGVIESAIRDNNEKTCYKLVTMHYQRDYGSRYDHDSETYYSFPMLKANTCLTAVRAVNKHDLRECTITTANGYFIGDKYGPFFGRFNKIDQLLVSRDCTNIYDSHFPAEKVAKVNVLPVYKDYRYYQKYYSPPDIYFTIPSQFEKPTAIIPEICDSLLSDFDKSMKSGKNPLGEEYLAGTEGDKFVAGTIYNAECVGKKNGYFCDAYDLNFLGKELKGKVRWKTFMLNGFDYCGGEGDSTTGHYFYMTCFFNLKDISSSGVIDDKYHDIFHPIDHQTDSCKLQDWKKREARVIEEQDKLKKPDFDKRVQLLIKWDNPFNKRKSNEKPPDNNCDLTCNNYMDNGHSDCMDICNGRTNLRTEELGTANKDSNRAEFRPDFPSKCLLRSNNCQYY